MTYDDAIEKNNALMQEIKFVTNNTGIDIDKINRLKALAEKVYERCESDRRYMSSTGLNDDYNEQYNYLYQINNSIESLLDTLNSPAIMQADNGLSKINESLNTLNQELTFSKLAKSQSDIIDKMLLIEAEYQKNNNDEQAMRNMRKLEKLDSLYTSQPELTKSSADIKNLLNIYHEKMPTDSKSSNEYNQDLSLSANFEHILTEEQNAVSMLINNAKESNDSNSYNMNNLDSSLDDTFSSLQNLDNLFNETGSILNKKGLDILANLTRSFRLNQESFCTSNVNAKQNNKNDNSINSNAEHISSQIIYITATLCTSTEIDCLSSAKNQLEKVKDLAQNMPDFLGDYIITIADVGTRPVEHRQSLFKKLNYIETPKYLNSIDKLKADCNKVVNEIANIMNKQN